MERREALRALSEKATRERQPMRTFMRPLTSLTGLAVLAALLAPIALAPGAADAQRRRRRSHDPAPAAAPAPDAPAPNPFEEPAAAPPSTPPAAPAAAPAPSTPPAASTTAAPTVAAPATPPAAPPVDPGPTPPDVAPVRAELGTLMDEMVQTRQRMAVLGQELFRTRIRVAVQDRAGDDQSLAHFVVELDGAPIFRSDGELEGGSDGRTVHEGALAPGPHVLTIESEQRARDDAEVRYVERQTFRIQVHRERLTDVVIVLEDDSNMVEAFRQGGEGHFDVRTRVRVATRELPPSSK